MANLTTAEKLVQERPDLNTLSGHALVVFEKKGEGHEVREIVLPGQTFKEKKSFSLFNRSSYFAYAVNLDERLRLEFADRVDLQDHLHSVDVTFYIEYCVTDPKLVADKLNSDPLKRLRDRIKQVIGLSLSVERWEEIRDDFLMVKARILGNDSASVEEVRDFANDVGLAVKGLELKVRLQEIDRKIDAIERNKTVKAAQVVADLEIQSLRDNYAIGRKAREKMVDAMTTAVGNLADKTDNADALGRNVGAVTQALSAFTQPLVPDGRKDSRYPLLNAASNKRLLGESSTGSFSLIIGVLEQVNGIDCSATQKNRLMSAILHLIGELLLGDDGDPEKVDEHGASVREQLSKMNLSFEQHESFRKFFNYDAIRDFIKFFNQDTMKDFV